QPAGRQRDRFGFDCRGRYCSPAWRHYRRLQSGRRRGLPGGRVARGGAAASREPRMSAKTVSEQTPETQNANGLVDLAILDDDLDFCNYLEDALKDDGLYLIRTFAHPAGLFAACEQRLPDIVLLDMKMGEFKGDKVLEQLQTA